MRQLLTGLAQDIASLAIELLGLLHRATASWFFHPFYKVIVRTFPGLPSLLPLPVRMSLPQLATVEILSPLVTRVLGLNPGAHTLQGTCTYLIGKGRKRILLDTGEGRPAYPALVKQALAQTGGEGIETVLLTHHHYDHCGGLDDIRREFGAKIPSFKRLEGCSSGGLTDVQHMPDGAVFSTEGATLHAVYTPGHTDDHVSFWLEEEQALFSGDCILGHGTTVFDDLKSYLDSLALLLRIARGQGREPDSEEAPPPPPSSGAPVLTRIYPGHGSVIASDPVGVIETYIEHRKQREAQVLQVLGEAEQRGETGGLTSLQLVQQIYTNLPPTLVLSAQWNIEHHLHKLLKEGKIRREGYLGRWRLASDKSA